MGVTGKRREIFVCFTVGILSFLPLSLGTRKCTYHSFVPSGDVLQCRADMVPIMNHAPGWTHPYGYAVCMGMQDSRHLSFIVQMVYSWVWFSFCQEKTFHHFRCHYLGLLDAPTHLFMSCNFYKMEEGFCGRFAYELRGGCCGLWQEGRHDANILLPSTANSEH